MRYYLIAGEASGDLHGSNLIKGLKATDTNAEFRFWGGDLMAEAAGGREGLVRHYREGAVMGFSDVLAKAGRLLANVRHCKEDISGWRPDVVILIDYPGFNFRVAEYAHKAGFKVFYYIAPKTWASREGRNRKLRRFVDRLFIIFPFEIPYFSKRGIPFTYRGNPLLDAVDGRDYSRPTQERYIAILPGSRKGEISRTMPVCREMASRLRRLPQYEGCKFIVAGAPSRDASDYGISEADGMELMFGRTYDILKFADAAVINSGTASLEAALIGTPQLVCWSTSPLTAWIAKHILKVMNHIKYISLGNLIVDKPVFKEFIQDDFNADNLVKELRSLVEDGAYRTEMLSGYSEIRESLGGTGASKAVAEAMLEELNQ